MVANSSQGSGEATNTNSSIYTSTRFDTLSSFHSPKSSVFGTEIIYFSNKLWSSLTMDSLLQSASQPSTNYDDGVWPRVIDLKTKCMVLHFIPSTTSSSPPHSFVSLVEWPNKSPPILLHGNFLCLLNASIVLINYDDVLENYLSHSFAYHLCGDGGLRPIQNFCHKTK